MLSSRPGKDPSGSTCSPSTQPRYAQESAVTTWGYSHGAGLAHSPAIVVRCNAGKCRRSANDAGLMDQGSTAYSAYCNRSTIWGFFNSPICSQGFYSSRIEPRDAGGNALFKMFMEVWVP